MNNLISIASHPSQDASQDNLLTSVPAPELTLAEFLQQWDEQYQEQASQIELFNPAWVASWTEKQKIFFTQAFYHQRAHFVNFLWYLGNVAPDSKSKQMILNNIKDEFGGERGFSHEQLYLNFAESMGVDLTNEFIDPQYYLPFLKDYNQGHLQWLHNHDWHHQLSSYAAYERLDRIDYLNLKTVAQAMGATGKAMTFFNVHIYVKHYEEAEAVYYDVWQIDPKAVKAGFKFISNHQMEIWRKMSNAIKNCH
jgi:pyrroloquinoline quinone (PQQ) biosynthesis protein C